MSVHNDSEETISTTNPSQNSSHIVISPNPSISAIRTSLTFLLEAYALKYKDFILDWSNLQAMYNQIRTKKTKRNSFPDKFRIGLIRLLGEYMSVLSETG